MTVVQAVNPQETNLQEANLQEATQLGTLKLAKALDASNLELLEQTLNAVAGVTSAKASVGGSTVNLTYDANQVNLQQLKDTIVVKGFLLAVHGEDGNCCGGCGS